MSEKRPVNDQSTDGREKKKKKSKNKKLSVLRLVILTIFIVGIIGAGAAVGIVAGIIKDAPPIDASNIYNMLEESSFILDANGQVIEKIQSDEVRIIVDYKDIPDHVKNAFVAIEDRRFWTHGGIDLKGIMRVIWTNLTSGTRHGASTINQQLAINLFHLRSDSSYSRKIKDMYYGIMLNQQLSKEQILEAYLNTINLGGSVHGVQAAAQVYFSKDVSELSVAEAALIAGITRYPYRYAPMRKLEKADVDESHYVIDDTSDPIYTYVFNEQCLDRMKVVLDVMRSEGYIDDAQYEAALAEDIRGNLKPNELTVENISSYFGDLVKRDVIAAIESLGYSREDAQSMLNTGGLKIYSTLDVNAQQILEEEFEKSENFPKSLKDADGNLVRDEHGNIQPQAAMVIIDYYTGQIKALVGGRMTSGQKIYNRALAPRQPGSSIKPIAVYTAAIDQGLTAATVIDDIPIYYNKGTPTKPWPSNWYRDKYYGLITMRESIQQSSNVGAVLFADMLGPDQRSSISTMLEYMKKMGISTVVTSDNPVIVNNKKYTDETFSTALGGMTKGVTPLEITTAFGVLANQGVKIDPITFTAIYDRNGNLLYENTPVMNRVVTPQVAYVMTDMLRSAVTSGTGSRAKLDSGNSKIPVAGKTGTTSDRKDAWFVGYTPYYVASVWIGYDMPEALSDGSTTAAILWQKVMSRIHEGYSPKDFTSPAEGLKRVNICTKSGKLPGEYCEHDPRGSTIRSEIFIIGTEPTDTCDVHVLAEVHTPTGKLATDLTPPWEIESKVFVQRPVPYFPEEHNGITPRDYIYELPTTFYDPLQDWNENTPIPPEYNQGGQGGQGEEAEEGNEENIIDFLPDFFNNDQTTNEDQGPSNLRNRRQNANNGQ